MGNVVIQAGLERRRLNNGQTLELVAVRKDGSLAVRSTSGRTTYELDAGFGHLAHGYCTTSHASQGKTVDEVFISQPGEMFAGMDERQVYVSLSRGKEICFVYMNSKQ
ncbi:helicase C-terminal domain-containing protein, partial [Nostoc sp. NIES-2111]